MKLLFIYYDRPDYFVGPIVNARRLLPELQSRGHEIHCLIFYRRGDSPSSRYLESHGVRCYVRPFAGATEEKISWILEKVVAISPDVFVPNLSVVGWFAARWVRDSGIPTISCHRSDDQYHWAMVDEFVLGQKEWAVSGLVCVSEHLRKEVAERRPEHTKLCVIPSGVPISKDSCIHDGGPLKLVYVGRMVQEQKRILDMVDALAMVMGHLPDVTATLYGDGPERMSVEKRVNELGLSHRINVAGVCPSEKIQSQLIQHHVLVLLSDYEGTPGAVMDAMACGVVPVCLDIKGGVQELVIDKHTGLLVKDREQDFLAAIKLLSNDPSLRKSMALKAKQHIVERYSLLCAADKWEEFCEKLLDSAPGRRPLIVPDKFNLPPVRSGLAREDFRKVAWPLDLAKRSIKLLKRKLMVNTT